MSIKFSHILNKLYYRLTNKPVNTSANDPSYLLNSTKLFKHIEKNEFDSLCQAAVYTDYKPGDIILKEGDIGDKFYVIAQGCVHVLTVDPNGHEILLAILENEAYFGEQALVEEAPARRNATIKAASHVRVLELSRPYIVKALKLNNKLKDTLKHRGKQQLIQKLAKQLDVNQTASQHLSKYLDGEIHCFADKEIVFSKGESPDKVYFILEGAVHIYLKGSVDKPELVANVSTGQFFGELGVLETKPRLGTAITNGPTKLLVMETKAFKKIYDTIPELRELINTRKRIYNIPQRGIVNIVSGTVSDKHALTATFNLANGQTIIASQVVGENIFKMTYTGFEQAVQIQYEDENATRLIGMVDEKIVSITNLGIWNELGYACRMLLDQVRVEPWQISFFQQSGSFNIHYDTSEIICYCMQVTRGTVADAIRAGINDLDALSIFTGAGSVCGSCRTSMMEMLGRSTWSVAYIDKIIPLKSDVRAYQIKLYDSRPSSYHPGQYIVVQSLINRHWVDRAFTLTSVSGKDDYYEIVIKRKQEGYFTPWLFDNDEKTPIIRVSLPHGAFIFDLEANRPAVFFAGGIGMTPALAFVRSLSNQTTERQLYVDYSAHTVEDLIYSAELMEASKANPQFKIKIRTSHNQGRLEAKEIEQAVKRFPDADFYICGPDDYQLQVLQALKSCGIADHRIHIESFSKGSSPNY